MRSSRDRYIKDLDDKNAELSDVMTKARENIERIIAEKDKLENENTELKKNNTVSTLYVYIPYVHTYVCMYSMYMYKYIVVKSQFLQTVSIPLGSLAYLHTYVYHSLLFHIYCMLYREHKPSRMNLLRSCKLRTLNYLLPEINIKREWRTFNKI